MDQVVQFAKLHAVQIANHDDLVAFAQDDDEFVRKAVSERLLEAVAPLG